MNEREALRLALEALEYPGPSWLEARQPAITAIKQALEQPEPEPVAIIASLMPAERHTLLEEGHSLHDSLYTYPPKREPLTDVQIATLYWGATGQSLRPKDNALAHKFARAIEASHGIKGEA